jgi:hypothetical protein
MGNHIDLAFDKKKRRFEDSVFRLFYHVDLVEPVWYTLMKCWQRRSYQCPDDIVKLIRTFL